jgi:hypothetical protein
MLAVSLAFAGVSIAAPLNLYEWLAVAPVVVSGENLGTYGKYAEFRIERVLRGDLAPDSTIRVAARRANRDRNRHVDRRALKFDKGLSYVLLLAPAATRKSAPRPAAFDLVRGPRGAREVPLEGREAFLGALERFARIQDRNDDRSTWRELGDMLEDTDPLLIETALEQHLKFRRGGPDRLGALRPLLDHPSHTLREGAARVIGQILERREAEPIPDLPMLQSELAGKARRDPAVSVRVAATEALSGIDGTAVDAILAEIARDDPDQTVRYTAERLIHDRQRQLRSVERHENEAPSDPAPRPDGWN